MYSAVIKKLLLRVVVLLFCLPCFLYASCAKADVEKNNMVKVCFIDSVFFTMEKGVVEVKKGQDLAVTLKMLPEFEPTFCNYENYQLEKTGQDEYLLTLYDIMYSKRVRVQAERVIENRTNTPKSCSIIYDLNDGTERTEEIEYSYSYHIRPNTKSSKGIYRVGYTPIGWNTLPNGEGEHIGFGSRVTVEDGSLITLYAEWVKQVEANQFRYEEQNDGSICLVGYRGKGTDELFVLPSEIDGKKVSAIGNTFTTNIPCGKVKSKTLVLPSTIENVERNAFINCDFEEMYFFDNLQSVDKMAFSKNISHYHINANTNPKLQKENYNARFADNLDLIITNADQKKLIFFSGCSMTYGLSSELVQKEFQDYVVINAGLNGEFNAIFQLECMLPFIHEGDILIHAPEQPNVYQFFTNYYMDSRVFAMVEGNYDLLSAADFSYTNSFFDAWGMYVDFRSEQEECSYSDYNGYFNIYGDYMDARPYDEKTEVERDVSYTEIWGYDIDILTPKTIKKVSDMYEKFIDRGAKVYFSWAPMNDRSTYNEDVYQAAKEYQARLKELFDPYGYSIISEVTNYIYQGRYFYDTDYHLNDVGVILRTEQLIDDLKKIIE